MLQVAGIANAKQNRRQEAEKIISKFREIEKTQYIVSYFVASIYVSLGEPDKAFVELNKAFEKHDLWLRWMKVDPHFDSLHNDPRYKDLLKRMGLLE
jgi:predicted Zn-dependent protease